MKTIACHMYEVTNLLKKSSQLDRKGFQVVAVEGLNGVGKSTLIDRYAAVHPEIICAYSTPQIYLSDEKLKRYILFDATPTASALYYLAALADTRHILEQTLQGRYLFDRSIWSTLAAAFAKKPDTLKSLCHVVLALKDALLIPDTVIVLQADYTTCQKRVASKIAGAEFDQDSLEVFQRKNAFYEILVQTGFDIRFIETTHRSADEVFEIFEAMDVWGSHTNGKTGC